MLGVAVSGRLTEGVKPNAACQSVVVDTGMGSGISAAGMMSSSVNEKANYFYTYTDILYCKSRHVSEAIF